MSRQTRILLVDDDPGVLEVLSQLLRLKGYEVNAAQTGGGGLSLAREWGPDLVLLDVRLPDLDGTEVCRRIKSDPALADVFVILLSGEATSAAQKAGGLDIGADEYLTKPVEGEELLARVRTAARLQDTAAALRASEQHYRRLVEILPDAVAWLDLGWRLRAANPRALGLLGFPGSGDWLGRSLLDLAPLEERERLRLYLEDALRLGRLQDAESVLLRPNGERCPVEISAALSADPQGRPDGLVLVARDISERKRAEHELRRLPARIIEAQEAERLRVARELHDGVNQLLAAAKMRLRRVEDHAADLGPGPSAMLAGCGDLLVRALEENRRIAHCLRPSDLDALGLADACRHLCEEFRARSGLAMEYRITLSEERLAPAAELGVFRIVQEALSNVEQHAQAASVWLTLEAEDGTLALSIRDNGRGFESGAQKPAKGKHRGIGLTNMSERAASLGGTCDVRSEPGQGTDVVVRVPMRG